MGKLGEIIFIIFFLHNALEYYYITKIACPTFIIYTSFTGDIALAERVVLSALLSLQESRVGGELIWNILFSNACGYGLGLTGYHAHCQALSAGLFTFLKPALAQENSDRVSYLIETLDSAVKQIVRDPTRVNSVLDLIQRTFVTVMIDPL